MAHQHQLQYSTTADALGRPWRWVAVMLALLPVAAVGSIHLVYGVEWLVNGERPIPPLHGPDNIIEEALYLASHLLLLPFLFSVAADAALPVVAVAKGVHRPPLLFVLPVASWAVGFVILFADPIRAMYFWVD